MAEKIEGGSWKKKLQTKWGPHSHCIICGRATAEEKQTCSQECMDKYQGETKKKGKQSKIQMIMLVAMVAVMMIFMFLGGGLGG
ncbi:MAG: hypothetical protein RBG13Loki_2873 [Promethearchaeota archaeon CR_4]|nr:MAG: hypothetical protein RBG13Loki_2873 [Candidatus Lokiarchaeota archaeon CR_4]